MDEKIITKAKVDIRGGLIDLEGTEEFVQKNLDYFKEKISKELLPSPGKMQTTQNPNKNEIGSEKFKVKTNVQKTRPVPFDVSEGNGKPSLKKFFDEKKPNSSHFEAIACISYYLDRYCNINEFDEGLFSFAYVHLGKKFPQSFHQAFLDTKNQKFYLDSGSISSKWRLSEIGRDFVENNLPRKQ